MTVLINDSESVESTPVMHRHQLLSKLFHASAGFDLLLEHLENSVFYFVA